MGDSLYCHHRTGCIVYNGDGVCEPYPCPACNGTGWRWVYRTPTPADLAAHLRTLPHEEQVAALVALLRECPDAAVEAVDTCKVARGWVGNRTRGRMPLAGGSDLLHAVRVGDRVTVSGVHEFPSVEEAMAWADDDLVSLDWVLAGVPRVG